MAVAVAGVDLGLDHPATLRLAFLTGDRSDGLLVRGLFDPMREDEPDGPLAHLGIDLLWHNPVLSARKEAASNPGRFKLMCENPDLRNANETHIAAGKLFATKLDYPQRQSSARQLGDELLMPEIQQTHAANRCAHWVRKMHSFPRHAS